MKLRGFEKIAKYAAVDFPMPERKTQKSAGYDFCLPEDVVLEPGKLQLVPTGIKAYMQDGEYLGMHIRSSMAVKKRIMLVNNVGIIDADYYNNADNEGHIMLKISHYLGDYMLTIKQGDGIVQGVFVEFGITENDESNESRNGGFGSTGR